jgi:hypothetical protein
MEEVIEKLKNIETVSLKKPFSLLEMLYNKVHGKEVAQSEMLAGLLSPDENHRHGFSLIESFLKEKEIGINVSFSKESYLKVETERSVFPKDKNPRRIDIFISWKESDEKHAVIIENKLYNAVNQENQLNDYYQSIIDEGYIVDKIVYMPLSKNDKSFEHTDANDKVRKIAINFDAQDIVHWLERVKNNTQALLYKEFLETLISNQHIMQTAIKILEHLSFDAKEINKLEQLAKIVNTPEWSEVRVKPITEKLEKDFSNLEIKGVSKLNDGSECNNYVELFFRSYKFWIELWLYPEYIAMYLCSRNDEGNPVIADIQFQNECYEEGRYFYYEETEKKFKFDYSNENGLIETLKPILKALAEYKE